MYSQLPTDMCIEMPDFCHNDFCVCTTVKCGTVYAQIKCQVSSGYIAYTFCFSKRVMVSCTYIVPLSCGPSSAARCLFFFPVSSDEPLYYTCACVCPCVCGRSLQTGQAAASQCTSCHSVRLLDGTNTCARSTWAGETILTSGFHKSVADHSHAQTCFRKHKFQ